jgi:hypothetical protein
MKEILFALISVEVLSALFALLHSVWDTTRTISFAFLTKLVVACHASGFHLPPEYTEDKQLSFTLARGIYLASSPRQREADTGARILAFLYASLSDADKKDSFLSMLVDVTSERILSMKEMLKSILSGHVDSNLNDGTSTSDGAALPLSHGLVHATRLCFDHDEMARTLLGRKENKTKSALCESIIDLFCKALQLSLAVVADMRDGEIAEGIDEDALFTIDQTESDSTPLNVNTGAIGANGTFSSVSVTSSDETRKRLATQRIVVSYATNEDITRARTVYSFFGHLILLFIFLVSCKGWYLVANERNLCCHSCCTYSARF